MWIELTWIECVRALWGVKIFVYTCAVKSLFALTVTFFADTFHVKLCEKAKEPSFTSLHFISIEITWNISVNIKIKTLNFT